MTAAEEEEEVAKRMQQATGASRVARWTIRLRRGQRRAGGRAGASADGSRRGAWRRLRLAAKRSVGWMATPRVWSALTEDDLSPIPSGRRATGSPLRRYVVRPRPPGRPLAPAEWAVALRNLTAELGATPDGVAASLWRLGVRERPQGLVNPVGAYLHAVLGADPEVESVMVERGRVVVWRHGHGDAIEVRLPAAARRFLIAFAEGAYPALHDGARWSSSTS